MKTKLPVSLFLSVALALVLFAGCQSATTDIGTQDGGNATAVIAEDAADDLYVTDVYGNRVRKVTYRDCTFQSQDAANNGGAFVED